MSQSYRRKTEHKSCALSIIFAGFMVFAICVAFLKRGAYEPFGNNTLAVMDAKYQYLDFYSFLRDVLTGKNNIAYTFSKQLGSSAIAIYSYYLASPLSLLVVFFSKGEMNAFFDWLIVLKLSAIAVSCQYYLVRRFEGKWDNFLKKVITICLSTGFALCQYNISQASNIMWLDGVFFLPLMLLMVYEIVRGKNSGWKLSVVVGLAIISNWYSAGLNCLFSIVWYFVEALLQRNDYYATVGGADGILLKQSSDDTDKLFTFKYSFLRLIRYGLSMMIGVMLSAILFLPTIKVLREGPRGKLEFERLKDTSFIGYAASVITNYTYGAQSSYGSAALFCGCLTLIGFIAFFYNKTEKTGRKLILGMLSAFGILMLYWNPAVMAFSLLKYAGSYFYRYSYLNIFILIFTAAVYYSSLEDSKSAALPLKCGVIFAVLLFMFDYVKNSGHTSNLYKTAVMMLVTGALISLGIYVNYLSQREISKKIIMTLLGVTCLADICLNVYTLASKYSGNDGERYLEYAGEQEKQIFEIKEKDPSLYRISQTLTRDESTNDYGITSMYNDALAYNYWSISGYTSSPDGRQLALLQNFGYPVWGDCLNSTNTSILPADSLLGVKYTLASKPVTGLVKCDDFGQYNGKDVYVNPYALPMAFVCHENDRQMDPANPFVYQNSFYSKLLGRDVELYKPVTWEASEVQSTDTGQMMHFTLKLPKGNYGFYGQLPWNSEFQASVNVNNQYNMSYARWLSPSVFDIPASSEAAVIMVTSSNNIDFAMDKVCFYSLDLDLLKQVTEELASKTPQSMSMKNGYVSINIQAADEGENLYLSVPQSDGWLITENGNRIEGKLIGDCLYSLPLEKGSNEIKMTYKLPGLRPGILISAAAMFLIMINILTEKRHKVAVLK